MAYHIKQKPYVNCLTDIMNSFILKYFSNHTQKVSYAEKTDRFFRGI
jgi:hypothetical protein